MRIGIFGTSSKRGEQRIPIHPDHLPELAKFDLDLVFEEHYGVDFGPEVQQTLDWNHFRQVPRDQLFKECDLLILPKPTLTDLRQTHEGQTLWGWHHLVQGPEITQLAIDRKLTMIAWEGMYYNGNGIHIFHRNNELAGYASVIHACTLHHRTGQFGKDLRATVIGYGSTGRGAIKGLKAMGVHELYIVTQRPSHLVQAPTGVIVLPTFQPEDIHDHLVDDGYQDIIVLCVLQDPNHPRTYIYEKDLPRLRSETLLIDVSCDEKMGFEFSSPTSLDRPLRLLGKERHVTLYAVDHSPTLFYRSASYEISSALMPYIRLLQKPNAWAGDPAIERATEIHKGVIHNQAIITYQQREPAPPHDVIEIYNL